MSNASVFFLGCARIVREDWQQFIPELAVAKNLKDPVKIQEARDAARAGLIDLPIVSLHSEITLIDRSGAVVLHAKPGQVVTELFAPTPLVADVPGLALMTALAKLFPEGIQRNPQTGSGGSLFGLDIREELRVAAMLAGPFAQQIGMKPAHWRMPSLGESTGMVDVYEYLLSSDHRKQLSVVALQKSLGLTPGDAGTATGRAQIAYNIATRMNLV